MNKNGSITSVWPLGEGAAKPGIEWPEGPQSALADYGSLFHKPTSYFIPLGASIPLLFLLLQGGDAIYRLFNNYFFLNSGIGLEFTV